jgi:zinc protease
VNSAVRARYESAPPILSLATKDDVAGVPDEATLEGDLAGLQDREVTDREAAVDAGDSLMDAPVPAEQTDGAEIPGRPDFYIEPVTVTFENGVRVILNPSGIVDDRVEIYAFSPGGFSLTAPEDAPAVWLMNEVNVESGFGDLDAVQVEQILGSTTVDVSPFPSPAEEYFTGSSSTGDLELAMQLIHQYVAASNFDEQALQRAVDRNLGYVADPGADADLATEIALNDARYGTDPRFRVVLTEQDLRAITTEQLQRVWAERFGNAGDFVFVFSGDLDVDATIDLAARYLGTLPSTTTREVALDVAPPVPAGIVTREVHAGNGETSQLVVQYTAPSDGTAGERIDADLLTVVLENRLTAHIREALGASYSPSAQVGVDPGPPSEVTTGMRISGAPEDMARIAEVLQDDLAELRTNGPTADEMEKAIAEVKEQYGLINDREITRTLERWTTDGNAIEDYANAYTDVEAVTAAELHEFVLRVLPAGQYIQVTQLPR